MCDCLFEINFLNFTQSLETETLDSDGIELSLEEQMKGMQLEEMAEDGDGSLTKLSQLKIFDKTGISTKVKHRFTIAFLILPC